MDTAMMIALIFVALLFFMLGKILYNWFTGSRGAKKHCMTCGVDNKVKSMTRGNTAIELLLWLCFIVPGLIYSIWRVSSRYEGCGTCGATTVVPLDAPAAVAHRKTLGIIPPVAA